jgi:nucleoside-diphosphate-sugar epimerase
MPNLEPRSDLAGLHSARVLITGGSGFIGTHVVENLRGQTQAIINLDRLPPHIPSHRPLWTECDLLNQEKLRETVRSSAPTHVVHLAARADSDGRSLPEYEVNTVGTSNLLEITAQTLSIQRFILTSTQFVHRPGHLPRSDDDYEPHTVYGESKVLNEKQLRALNPPFAWTIIRPTNIWGPWHPRYPREFWKVLRDGFYVHPGGKQVIRSYGYVKNVAWQIARILEMPVERVDRQVFYVGDAPIDLLDWVNGFSLAIRRRPVRVIPRPLFWLLALGGECVKRLGLKAPLHLSRYRSMVEDYPTPMGRSLETLGPPPHTMADGIDQTVEWLRQTGFFATQPGERS